MLPKACEQPYACLRAWYAERPATTRDDWPLLSLAMNCCDCMRSCYKAERRSSLWAPVPANGRLAKMASRCVTIAMWSSWACLAPTRRTRHRQVVQDNDIGRLLTLEGRRTVDAAGVERIVIAGVGDWGLAVAERVEWVGFRPLDKAGTRCLGSP